MPSPPRRVLLGCAQTTGAPTWGIDKVLGFDADSNLIYTNSDRRRVPPGAQWGFSVPRAVTALAVVTEDVPTLQVSAGPADFSVAAVHWSNGEYTESPWTNEHNGSEFFKHWAYTYIDLVDGNSSFRKYSDLPKMWGDMAPPPFPVPVGWSTKETGSLCCGPGSYYLDKAGTTEIRRDITTEAAAARIVAEINQSDVQNPVIMWQLTNPHGQGEPAGCEPFEDYFLVMHRLKFLSEKLDNDTGKPLESGFVNSVSNFQSHLVFGSRIYYSTTHGTTVTRT